MIDEINNTGGNKLTNDSINNDFIINNDRSKQKNKQIDPKNDIAGVPSPE